MDSNDHLKWLIGDLAFTLAVAQGRAEALEAELKQLREQLPQVNEASNALAPVA